MFNFLKKSKAGQGTFVLLYIRQSNFASAISVLRPQEVIEFIRINTEICESIAAKTRGAIIRLQGDCIIAWNEDELGPRTVDYRKTCETLVNDLRDASRNIAAKSSFEPKTTLAITKGLCIFERKDGEYASLFGDPMNRIAYIGAKAPLAEDVTLVDTSLKDLWPEAQLVPFGDGVFRRYESAR